MKKHLWFFAILLALGFLAVAAIPTQAKAALQATLSSVSPNDATDISDRIPSKNQGETFKAYEYASPVDTEYTFVFNLANDDGTAVTRAPFFINVGSIIKSYSFDSTTQQVTIIVTAKTFFPPDSADAQKNIIFAMVPTIESTKPGEGGGPPHAMAGGYVSMTVLDFRILPPMPGDPGFGLSLSGNPGTSGIFQMFMPKTMFDFMTEMTGKTITPKDLAIFIDDQQASVSVSELNGGAFIDISITFKSGDTTAGAAQATGLVTKEIVAKQKLPLSLAARKATVKKNKNAVLYGWLKNRKRGQEISILRKKKGEKNFAKIATVKTKKGSYFRYKFQNDESGTYFYKAQYKAKKSPKVRLKVK